MADRFRWMEARYDGVCADDPQHEIHEGDRICYDTLHKCTYCEPCGEAIAGADISLEDAEDLASP